MDGIYDLYPLVISCKVQLENKECFISMYKMNLLLMLQFYPSFNFFYHVILNCMMQTNPPRRYNLNRPKMEYGGMKELPHLWIRFEIVTNITITGKKDWSSVLAINDE